MPSEYPDKSEPKVIERRARDDELLAELTAQPTVEEAREAYDFWSNRRATLPVYDRAERKEADQMAARWKERLAAAERQRYGPSLLEQLFTALGVRRPPQLPSRRKIMFGLSVIVVFFVVLLIALLVATVVFWPDIQPIVRTLLNSNGGGG